MEIEKALFIFALIVAGLIVFLIMTVKTSLASMDEDISRLSIGTQDGFNMFVDRGSRQEVDFRKLKEEIHLNNILLTEIHARLKDIPIDTTNPYLTDDGKFYSNRILSDKGDDDGKHIRR